MLLCIILVDHEQKLSFQTDVSKATMESGAMNGRIPVSSTPSGPVIKKRFLFRPLCTFTLVC